MRTLSAGFIGGGRVTRIILQAIKESDYSFSTIRVYDINQAVLTDLKSRFPAISEADRVSTIAGQDLVFIAVHPPAVIEVMHQIQNQLSDHSVLISLAPKITIEQLQTASHAKKVIRMIPNATSYISEGYNPICFSAELEQAEKDQYINVLSLLGKTFEAAESALEGYAMISAMLPTYFWFQWQYIQELGLQMGFSDEESKETVKATLLAGWKLFYDSGLEPDEVMDLIPVKPIGDYEDTIRALYEEKLMALYQKIKP